MLVSDYNYELPEERIAKFPPKERGSTRLLVLDRKTGAIQDSYYRNLDAFLQPGDVLILNDTRVMQSRLFCELPDGRKRELVVLEKHGDEPERVMYRGKLHEGDKVFINLRGASLAPVDPSGRPLGVASTRNTNVPSARLLQRSATGGRRSDSRCRAPYPLRFNEDFILVKHLLGNGIAEVESATPLNELAEKYGEVPLPPYLHRDADANDKKRYQTVFAKRMGSAAAPTASLNMTDELLKRLQDKGVIIKYLTLHVGLGTFLPIRSDKIEDHKMHSEWFHIPDDTIEAIKNPRGRTIALGTTVARTLEYYAKTGKTEGEDDIFIYPGFKFQIVDALITNFHAPKSTVLMLASAFAGWDHLRNAYDHAITEKYNFLSYGDSMLIC